MSNVPYLKGVRTRYVNILKKETAIALDLLATAEYTVDETELILKLNNCVERLQLYSDKVENQSEKLADAIGGSDTEFTNILVTENETVCDQAVECISRLKQFEEAISTKKLKKEEAKEKYGMDQIVELQKQMNTIVVSQMKQQHEFLEKQEEREKELATSVKLPKLDMHTFSGDKMKWSEFWDAFESAVHNKKKMSNVEKFNYLRNKVSGEARSAIQGLNLSNENYEVAIGILKERFGNEQEIIDLHYNQMINLYPASNTTSSLRNLLDQLEKHLRSLEVLKQNVNQDVFVAMIRAALPEDVLLQLEMLKGAKKKWTVYALRDKLLEYITAREHSEKKGNNSADSLFKGNTPPPSENRRRFNSGVWNSKSNFLNHSNVKKRFNPVTHAKQNSSKTFLGSAEALVVNTKQQPTTRYFDQCRYCDQRHWSDECPKYRTVSERKKQLKDSCFKCLKTGHIAKDCKKGNVCVHCGEVNDHHRSLCTKKFTSNVSSAHLSKEIDELSEKSACADEGALVSSGEMVLMQTAKTEIKSPNRSKCEQVRILLDSGSQRTYVTEKLADRLQLTRESEEEIKLVTFGSDKPRIVKTVQTKLSIRLNNDQYLDISANIVPVISGFVQRKALRFYDSQNIDHLVKSLDMADTIPTETESSEIELLIGNDYYLDISLSQKIEIQPGLYLLASKLGWILTGRTNECESSADETNMLILTYGTNLTQTNVYQTLDSVTPTKPDLEDFWNIESIGILDKTDKTNDEINDLCGLLMRFRLHQIAIVADIEKAFLQIGIQPNQRDVTRFLWLKDSGETRVESDNIQEYRFCRVPFGLISSPFLLGATIESHLESYDSELALKLKNDIYVDNLITGADSIESAIQVYHESKSIFREASMNLQEWISYNSEVNKVIDSVDSVCCDTVKVLGHNWVMESDSICLTKPNIPLESTHPTKRSVLKEIAAVFDPLGLFSPILLKGKVFLQSLWCKHLNWDDSIENKDLKQWSTIRLDSSSLSDLQVNRCIAMNGNGSDIKYHLICFCDASKDAYAAVVYLL